MITRFISLGLLSSALVFGASALAPAAYIAQLPPGAAIHAIAYDPAGFAVIVGDRPAGSSYTAFVSKVRTDGSGLYYYLEPGGTRYSTANAVAAGNDGSVYAAGTTSSADFPTTDGSVLGAAGSNAFVWKIGPEGSTRYSVLLGGDAPAAGLAIAVNLDGHAFVTGQTAAGFPISPGGMQSPAQFPWFVIRLDESGTSAVYSITGPGGTAIALDQDNNAYIAGSEQDPASIPITPGAFQTSFTPSVCGAVPFFSFGCAHQYVCKIDGTATTLYYCTYVSGLNGSSNSAIAVNAAGQAVVAGTTNSLEYPTTAGALQTVNQVVQPGPPAAGFQSILLPFPTSGFVTKLSADGSQLVYSTYLGGTAVDSISDLRLAPDGSPVVGAMVQSPDFPGLPQAPVRCLPQLFRRVPVVIRLDPDAASITSEAVIEGVPPCKNCGPSIVSNGNRVYAAGPGPYLASLLPDALPAPDPIACLADSADFAHVGPVAANQLVTIFGSGLSAAFLLVNGAAVQPISASDTQINFAMPSRLGGNTAKIEVAARGVTVASRTLPLVDRAPSLVLSPNEAVPACNGVSLPDGSPALVINADGSRNDCDHPAAPGSTVTLMVNGVGLPTPPLIQNTNGSGLRVESVSAQNGVAGPWSVSLRVPAGAASQYVLAGLSVQGVPVREQNAVIWVKAN